MASSRITGSGSFLQPGTNRPRTLTFLWTAGRVFPLSRRTLNRAFLGRPGPTTTFCLLWIGFLNFSLSRLVRMARLHRVLPFAATARTLSAASRTALPRRGASPEMLTRARAWWSLEEYSCCCAWDFHLAWLCSCCSWCCLRDFFFFFVRWESRDRSAVGFAIRDDDMVQQRWGN